MSELPDLASLHHEQKDELFVALYHRLVELHERVLELEARLAMPTMSRASSPICAYPSTTIRSRATPACRTQTEEVSGAFRTAEGAATFCTIRSYLATLGKQCRDLFESLVLTFKAEPPESLSSLAEGAE